MLAAFSLLCMIGAVVQRTRRKKALEQDLDRRAQLDAVRGELEQACQSLLHHQERAARRRFDISVDSVRLGLPPMPSDLQLKEREAELEAQRRQRTEWDEAQATSRSTCSTRQKRGAASQTGTIADGGASRTNVKRSAWTQGKMHSGKADGGSAPRAVEGVRSEAELLETLPRLRIQILRMGTERDGMNTRARAALSAWSNLKDPLRE